MKPESRVLGAVLARLVRSEFDQGHRGVRAPMLRLQGFEQDEITVAIEMLEAERGSLPPGIAIKIATRQRWPGSPESWFLAAHETQVQYRNQSEGGLVLFDFEDQPDAQSLRNMHCLRDGTILNPRTLEESKERRDLVLDLAWDERRGGSSLPRPEALAAPLEEVFAHCERERGELSLRAWVGFLVHTCGELGARGRAVSQEEVHRVIEAALPHLELFVDPELFEQKSGQVARRLVRNARMAAMANPAGKELDEEEIERRIATAEFKDSEGEPYAEAQQLEWREACADVLRKRSPANYERVPYRIWEQIFAKESTTKGLGTRIYGRLEKSAPERLAEYEDLDVQTGLDDRDSDAARLLLEHESTPDLTTGDCTPSLIDLVGEPLRRAVEKLANPRSPSVSDPLFALLRELYTMLAEQGDERIEHVRLGLVEGADDRGAYSRALFRFLYARTLASIMASSDGGVGIRFEAATELLNGEVDFLAERERLYPNAGRSDDEDSVDDEEDHWRQLDLELTTGGEGRVLRRFTWDPRGKDGQTGVAALARVVVARAPSARFEGEWKDLETWCERAMDPRSFFSGSMPPSKDAGPTSRWQDLRARVFATWKSEGLSVGSMAQFVQDWQVLLQEVLENHVPRNEADPELEAFLDMETLRMGPNRQVLLGTHPLRIRWIEKHFQFLAGHVQSLLQGELHLNPEVDEFFFGNLAEYSPHRQPPMLSPGHQTLSIATREFGWHEEYRPIVAEGHPSQDWVASVDGESILALVRVVQRYLEAHPHKSDGLSILFVSKDGEAEHVERLVREVRKGEYKSLVLTVHVVAPVLSHEEIARRLESLDLEERGLDDLLPRVRTVLHSDAVLEDEDERRRLGLEGSIDLALVPNLFGVRTSVQERTQGRRSGSFAPLFDDATHEAGVEDGGRRQNVSRDFLPRGGDTLLEGWSSLQVWRKTWNSIGAGDRDDVDFFSLQVLFTKSLDLFRKLHDWTHWVVTLDPYVGREQIEAIEHRPDVITVQPKVGKNGRYTLVVSSRTGSLFVTERLRHKLENDLGVASGEQARELAERVYLSARDFSPGVVLRALGLGRTTHEILGLVAARWAVEEQWPRRQDDLFEVWLSLDELTHWFGGAHRQRADMLRVIGHREGADLVLRFRVLEAKFREREDRGKGDLQLTRTHEVLEPAFRAADDPSADGSERALADAPMWRRELVHAIQQSASRSTAKGPFAGLWVRDSEPGAPGGLPAELRGEISDGKYRVEQFDGVLCTIGASDTSVEESLESSPAGHPWLRIGARGFQRILRAFVETDGQVVSAGQTQAGPEIVDTLPEPSPALPRGRTSSVRLAEGRGASTEPDSPPSLLPHQVVGGQATDGHGSIDGELDPADLLASSGTDETGASAPNGTGLSEAELEARYQHVLNLFAEFKIAVGPPDDGEKTQEGPAFYEVRVVPGRGVRSDRVLGQTRELKLALGLPETLEIRGFVDRGAVVFQVPKEDHERYFVDAEELWTEAGHPAAEITALRVPLGKDARGEPVWIDFSSSDSPHLLIGGTTGSGKSVALEAILAGLCRAHGPESLRLFLIDPKGTELNGFEGLPHVEGRIGFDADDAILLLEQAVEEMQRRYALFKGRHKRQLVEYNAEVDSTEQLPWHLMVLDEYADLTSDKDDRRRIEELLQRLAQKARAAGIHLIVATQKPSAEILSTAIRSNLPAQLALRVKTPQDSRMVMDETGAETLAGKGDAFLKTGRGVVRVQTACVEEVLGSLQDGHDASSEEHRIAS